MDAEKNRRKASLRLALLLAGMGLVGPAYASPAPQPKSIADIMRPRPGDPCSACRMVAYRHPQAGLPPAVQKMRLAIMDACVKCDPLQLEKLALPGRPHFEFSFNKKDKKPSGFWKAADKGGHRTLAKMMATLHLPYAHDGHVFIWPKAYGKDPQDKDWDILHEIYADRDIVLFKDYGGFTGMRLAIADDGDWIYAIEGD